MKRSRVLKAVISFIICITMTVPSLSNMAFAAGAADQSSDIISEESANGDHGTGNDSQSGQNAASSTVDDENTQNTSGLTKKVPDAGDSDALKNVLDSDDIYISKIEVKKITTGTGDFDAVADADKTATASDKTKYAPGFDENSTDSIIRNGDTIKYNLSFDTSAYTDGAKYKTGYVWFKIVLPYSKSEVTIDTDSMPWISTDNEYKKSEYIEELDIDNDGKTEKCQVLYAAKKITVKDGSDSALPGSDLTADLSLKVGTMKNGETIKPIVYSWMNHNNSENADSTDKTKTLDGNPSSWTDVQRTALSQDTVCDSHKDKPNKGKEVQSYTFKDVTVSAISDSDYEFTINGTDSTDVSVQHTFDMMENVELTVTDNNGKAVSEAVRGLYQLKIKSVTRKYNGAGDNNYNWDKKDTFTAPSESGYTYTIIYQVYHKRDGSAVSVDGAESAREVTVVTKSEIRDSLDDDDEYIGSASIEQMLTGTAPFDTESHKNAAKKADDNTTYYPGDDESADDTIIRTYDTIDYTLSVNTSAYTSGVTYRKGYVWYKFILPCDEKEAKIDTESMGWISDASGYESYKTTETHMINEKPVKCQVLYAARVLTPQEGQMSAFPVSNLSVNLAVKVRTMKNGDTITPMAYAWVDHNNSKNADSDGKTLDANPQKWTDAQRLNLGETIACDTHKNDKRNNGLEVKKFNFKTVTVSAAPSYNVVLNNATTDTVTTDWNFSTENPTAQDKDRGTVNGQGDRYGFVLMMQNASAGKGMKGLEAPQGDITFDLQFSQKYSYTDKNDGKSKTVDLDDDGEYNALVWNTNGACSGGYYDTQVKNGSYRSLSGKESFHQSTSTVYNSPTEKGNGASGNRSGSKDSDTAYNGGTWSAVHDGNTVHVTIKDYEVNMDWLPKINIWGAIASPTYDNSYQAVIGGGDMEVVHPFYSKSTKEYLVSKYGSGTISFTVKDMNFKAKSISGQVQQDAEGTASSQVQWGTDSRSRTIWLSRSGSYEPCIHYTYTSPSLWSDFNNVSNSYPGMTCYNNSQDVGQNGQKGMIQWGYLAGSTGFEYNGLVGVNSLMKFDSSLVGLDGEPAADGSYQVSGSITRHFLYAAKKDGSNWSNIDEMNKTTEDDLVYYSSMDALKKEGKTCVGILMEARTDSTASTNNNRGIFARVRVKVTEDPAKKSSIKDVNEHVAPIIISTTAWKKGGDGSGIEQLLGRDIPTRWGNSQNSYAKPEELTNAASNSSLVKNRVANNATGGYSPAEYNKDGTYIGGGIPANWQKGDSLYITPYKATITKSVAQTANGTKKNNYDLDNEQTVIDYAVTVKTNTLADKSSSGYSAKTDIKVSDILPDGLSYISGSSHLDGTYIQSDPVGNRGRIEGGTALDDPTTENLKAYINDNVIYPVGYPNISSSQKNAAKNYEPLTWTIKGADVGKSYTLRFSARIDKRAATNNQSYVNRAYISTTAGIPAFYTSRSPVSSYALCSAKVTKNSSVSLLVTPQKHTYTDSNTGETVTNDAYYHDAGGNVAFNMYWQNTSQNDAKSSLMMNTLPKDGTADSHFKGKNTLTAIKIKLPEGVNANDYTVCYSTNEEDAEKTSGDCQLIDKDSADKTVEDGKTAFTQNADGTWTLPTGWKQFAADDTTDSGGNTSIICKIPSEDADKITAWGIIGTIPGGKEVGAEMGFDSDSNSQTGDAYVNRISYGNGRSSSTAYIADRKIGGTAWIDSDKDGRRDGNEKTLDGVTATLYMASNLEDDDKFDKDGRPTAEPYKNLRGNKCTTKTGSGGKYSFENLEKGKYVIVFTGMENFKDSDNNNMYFLTDTKKDGIEAGRNCDAKAVRTDSSNGTILIANVEDIEMPDAAELKSSPYQEKNLDIGFTTSDPAAVNVKLSAGKKLLDAGTNGSEETDKTKMTDISSKITAGQFSFSLEDDSEGNIAKAISNDVIRLPESTDGKTKSFNDMTASVSAYDSSKGSASAVFDELTFVKEGTYTFYISENDIDNTSYKKAGKIKVVVEINRKNNPAFETSPEDNRDKPFILQPTVTYYDSNNNRLWSGVYTLNDDAADNAYIAPEETEKTAAFENVYTAPKPVTQELSATKELSGRELAAERFEFELTSANGSKNTGYSFEKSSAKNDADGKVDFGKVKFTEAGSYDFVMSEKSGNAKGYTYDSIPVQVHVVVEKSDDTDKNVLKVKSVSYSKGNEKYSDGSESSFKTESGTAKFNNSYKADAATDTVTAKKTVSQSDGLNFKLAADNFKFTLENTSKPDGTSDIENQTKGNGKGGDISFDPVIFNKAGEYVFTLKEESLDAGNLSSDLEAAFEKDDSIYTITYNVTDDGSGQLKYTKTVKKTKNSKETALGKDDSITFTNTYKPASVSKAVSGTKTVKSTTGEAYKQTGEEFSFKLADFSGNYNAARAMLGERYSRFFPEAKTLDPSVKTASNDKNGEITFSNESCTNALTFTAPGYYIFTVTEDDLSGAARTKGFTAKDNRQYVLGYKVDDNGTGKLTVSQSTIQVGTGLTDRRTEESVTFDNTYDPIDASDNISVKKTVSSQRFKLGANNFSFKLHNTAKPDGAANIEDQDIWNIAPADGSADSTASFEELTFSMVGTYTFEVTENDLGTRIGASGTSLTSDQIGAFTKDQTKYTITYNVKDIGNGSLTYDKTVKKKADSSRDESDYDSNANGNKGNKALEFTNMYKAAAVTGDIKGKKTVSTANGTAYKMSKDDFSFTLTPDNDSDPMPENAKADSSGKKTLTVKNDAPGTDGSASFDFGNISFDSEGTYSYTVKEDALDETKLGADKYNSLKNGKDDSEYKVKFEVEDTGSGKLTLKEGSPAITKQNAGNTADQLESADSIVFANGYEPAEAKAVPTGTKTVKSDVDGAKPYIAEGNFSFNISGGKTTDGTTASTTNDTVENSAPSGSDKTTANINFKELTFDSVGTYTYTVKENAVDSAAVTLSAAQKAAYRNGMDDSVYTLTYTVIDNGAGKLQVADGGPVITKETKSGQSEAASTVAFTNRYTPASTDAEVSGTKSVSASAGNSYTMKGGEFGFSLSDASSTYDASGLFGTAISPKALTPNITAAENEKNGSFKFESDAESGMSGASAAAKKALTFTEPGQYVFKVMEKEISTGGLSSKAKAAFTKDSTGYFLIYSVTDDGSGKLSVNQPLVQKKADSVNAAYEKTDSVAFTNIYKPETTTAISGDVKIDNTDSSTNRIPNRDEFSFVLTAGNSNTPMPAGASTSNERQTYTVKNGTAGGNTASFDFGNIKYDRPGTYEYTVTQTSGSDNSITYDSKSYAVTVTVTEKGGYLEAAAAYKYKNADEREKTAEKASYTNKYQPTGDEINIPTFKKTLTSTNTDRVLKNGEFTFKMTNTDVPSGAAKASDVTVTNSGNGSVSFGSIRFTKAGTYKYTVEEEDGDLGGVTYSETKYYLTAKVSENASTHKYDVTWSVKDGSGSTAKDVAESDRVFANTYTAESVTGSISGTKTVTSASGKAYEFKADEFSFTMKPAASVSDAGGSTGAVPMPQGAAGEGTAAAKTVKNAAPQNGKASFDFGNITFNKPGTYSYIVTENDPADSKGNTLKKDSSSYTVTYEVTDDKNGKLQITGSKPSIVKNGEAKDSISFTNTYKPKAATDTLAVRKTVPSLTGGVFALGADQFAFTLKNTANADTSANYDAQTKWNGAPAAGTFAGIAVFDQISFSKVGTYTFTVSENDIDESKLGSDSAKKKAALTKDNSVYTITYQVSDSGNGQLAYDRIIKKNENDYDYAGNDNALAFANNYSAKAVQSDDLSGIKKVESESGTDYKLAANEFSFNVKNTGNPEGVEQEQDQTVSSGEGTGSGSIDFGSKTFSKAGTYEYVIIENDISDNKNGTLTKDGSQYKVTYDVVDDGNGELAIKAGSPKIEKKAAGENEYKAAEKIEFINRYAPKAADAAVTAEKNVASDITDTAPYIEANDFSFNISGGKMADDGTVTETVNKSSKNDAPAAEKGKTADVSFGKLTFDKAGTYTYKVKENSINQGSISGSRKSAFENGMDSSVYTVTYNVTDDVSGQLKIDGGKPTVTKKASTNADTSSAVSDGKISFTNEYKPLAARETISGTKKVTPAVGNSYTMKGGEFKFDLADASDTWNSSGTLYASMFRAAAVSVRTAEAANEADGSFTFANGLEMSAPGNYVAELTEQDISKGNLGTENRKSFTKDDTHYFLGYQVSDNGSGQLYVSRSLFVTADPGASNISKLIGSYSYSSASAVRDYSNVEFNNKYAPETAESITGDVGIENIDSATSRVPEENEFTFNLKAETDKNGDASPMPEGSEQKAGETVRTITAKNAGADSASKLAEFDFGSINYTKPGEYEYTVTQEKGSDSTITYDEKSYDVTVTVTDKDGHLEAAAAYREKDKAQSKAAENASFTNKYKPAAVTSDVPDGEKIMKNERSSGSRILKNEEFGFTMTAKGSAPMPEAAKGSSTLTVRNTSDESGGYSLVDFGSINFTESGEYTYTISEAVPEDKDRLGGVTYDRSLYKAAAKVTENAEKHEYTASWTVTKVTDDGTEKAIGSNEKLRFENTYLAAPVSADVNAEKTVKSESGKKYNFKAGEFSFTLTAGNGIGSEVVPMPEGTVSSGLSSRVKTAANAVPENGRADIDFGEIRFTDAGTYTYTVTENNISDTKNGKLTKDDSVYTVTYKVIDDGSGQLAIENGKPKITKAGEETESVAFENAYRPDPASAEISATKTVTSKSGKKYDISDGEFSFTLKNTKTPEEVSKASDVTKTNDGNGNIDFGTLKFSRIGEYIYTLDEDTLTDAGSKAGAMKKDDSVYTITYDVTDDDQNGKLEVARSVSKSGRDENGNESTEENLQTIAFGNTYSPASVSDSVRVSKSVRSDVANADPKIREGNFSFTIEGGKTGSAAESAALAYSETKENKAPSTEAAKTADVVFSDLTFNTVGTYVYTISENSLDRGNLSDAQKKAYETDRSVYTVTYKVTDDQSGKLSLEKEITKKEDASADAVKLSTGDGISFINTYTPAKAVSDIPAEVSVRSESGESYNISESEFSFTVSGNDGTAAEGYSDKKSNDAASGSSDKADVDFESIEFAKPGTYVYTVTENAVRNDKDSTLKKDESEYTIKYVVEDDGSGKLKVTDKTITRKTADGEVTKQEGNEKLTFENIYRPKAAGDILEAVKHVKKNDNARFNLEEGNFSFTLKNIERPESADRIESQSKANDSEGKAKFDRTNFDKVGEYEFTVTEDDTDSGNLTRHQQQAFTKDEAVYNVKYTVTDENQDGQLDVTKKVTKKADPSSEEKSVGTDDEIGFTNTYNTGSITVTNNVTGVSGSKSKEFSYTLTLDDDSINGVYDDLTFRNGVSKFTLKDDQSVSAANLPNGTRFTVAEDDYSGQGYTTTVRSRVTEENASGPEKDKASDIADESGSERVSESGSINGDSLVRVSFFNTRNETGSLKISNELKGNDKDESKEFTYTVTASDINDEALNSEYETESGSKVKFEDGKATLTLTGTQSITIKEIPADSIYTVTQNDESGAGYVTETGDEKTLSKSGKVTADETDLAEFINTRDTYGKLTVSNKVEGVSADRSKAFRYTVILSGDGAKAGKYGDMDFETDAAGNVKAEFELKHGEHFTADEIPNGTGYTVTQDDYTGDGYITSIEDSAGRSSAAFGSEGIIDDEKSSEAAFINRRSEKGSLTVSNILAGNDTDTSKGFEYTIKVTDVNGDPVSGSYDTVLTHSEAAAGTDENGSMEFADGKASFILKGGESLSISDLPDDAKVTVTQKDYDRDGYVTTVLGEETFDAAGVIDSKSALAMAFTNTRDTFGDVAVSKTVSGSAGNREKKFSFTMELSDTSISGTYGDLKFRDGAASFRLANGESVKAKDLPNGVTCTVSENDYSGEGYKTTVNGKSTRVQRTTVNDEDVMTAAYTNTKEKKHVSPTGGKNGSGKNVSGTSGTSGNTSRTGDDRDMRLFIILMLMSAAVISGTAVYVRRRKR